MLYSGFSTLTRPVVRSADFNGRSDNLDVIHPNLPDMQPFWNHLSNARASSRGGIEKRLDRYLKKLEPNEIEYFAEDFAALKRCANTKPVLEAALIIGCGESEDGFTDFRSWIVLQGEHEFKRILDNADTLGSYQPDAIPIEEWHSDYYPSDIYELVTGGRELPWFDHGEYPNFFDSINVESLPARYPILSNRIRSTGLLQQADADTARRSLLDSNLSSITLLDDQVRLRFNTGAEILIANARSSFETKYGLPADSPDHPLLNQQVFSVNTEFFPISFFIWFSNRKKVSFGRDDGGYGDFTLTLPPTDG